MQISQLVHCYERKISLLQTLLRDVVDKQPDLDDVNQKAQSLLETNSDARISHTITQLTTKYQQLLSRVKVFKQLLLSRIAFQFAIKQDSLLDC